MLNWPSPALTDSHYQTKAWEQTHRLLRQAAKHYGISLPLPEVRFDLRGKAAGQIRFLSRCHALIRYNPTLLQDNGDAFIARTVPHEVAHLVARKVYGEQIKPHGIEWREIMAYFGADSSRCHSFTVRENKIRRMRYFPYRCDCQDHRLSAIRHHRHQAGTTYLCRRCGSSLRLIANAAG
jgi:SprT protein